MAESNFLIIGGTGGIGSAIAAQLVYSENQVWVCGRNASEFNELSEVKYLQVDVMSDELDFDPLPDSLNGLVYCPGTINLKPFHTLKDSDFLRDWELNFLGAVRCIRILLPRLRAATSSSIVLFSTVAAQQGMPFHSSIAAAKGAVEGFTRSLAAELAPDIRVNCVAPSLTDTELARRLLCNDQRKQEAALRHPLRRYGLPTDIAALACFLLSSGANWITGQVMGVDGGLSTLRV